MSFQKIQNFVLILQKRPVLEETIELDSPVSLFDIGDFDQEILKKAKTMLNY